MIKPGDRIIVAPTHRQGKWEPEELHGRHGVLLDLTRPHGYARVQLDGAPVPVLVHPESLATETP